MVEITLRHQFVDKEEPMIIQLLQAAAPAHQVPSASAAPALQPDQILVLGVANGVDFREEVLGSS
jgi:hypothetical protein